MILLGDCLMRLRELEADSVDSVVTDPPYGLSKEPDIAEVMKHWTSGDKYEHDSKGFMGKSWDSFVPGPEYWREVYRVLKPGAHVCVFAGTRTWDLMSCALRFAGFQNRDTIASFGGPPGLAWTFGSGFPKSHNISKAIDRAAGAEREVVGVSANDRPHSQVKGGKAFDRALDDGQEHATLNITAPATQAAKEWHGWGTALKPAWEVILVFRKPFDGPVFKNVLRWGVGGLNIAASRIEGGKRSPGYANPGSVCETSADRDIYGKHDGVRRNCDEAQGRWPANLLLDEEAAALLDEQSGTLKSGATKPHIQKLGDAPFQKNTSKQTINSTPASIGGASRFFYCAKASKSERNLGLEGMPEQTRQRQWAQSEGRTDAGKQESSFPQANTHPTVKPIKLMEYLIKLITPPGGLVLDPFAGSGSTGVAAFKNGFKFIGIEMNEEYAEIARKRLEHVNAG